MAEGAGRAPALLAGLRSRCPRCGLGALFAGFLDLRRACPACGLDYAPIDTGDGPAVFVIFIVGFLVVGAALSTELAFAPPYWLHLVIWLPAILLLSLGLLRPVKATLVALQFKHGAREHRYTEDDV